MIRHSKKNGARSRDLRAAWLAELEECCKHRLSLLRRIRRARRRGAVEDLEKQYWGPRFADGWNSVRAKEDAPWREVADRLFVQGSKAKRQGDLELADKFYLEAMELVARGEPFRKWAQRVDHAEMDRVDHEWEKIIPRRLRGPTGRDAWSTLSLWRKAHGSEILDLMKSVNKFSNNASYFLMRILGHLWLLDTLATFFPGSRLLWKRKNGPLHFRK
jgi:hypothetical protein